MTPDQSKELKPLPCPFCGQNTGVPTWHTSDSKRWFGVTCNNSDCRWAMVEAWESKDAAIEAWNLRPLTPQPAAKDEEIARLKAELALKNQAVVDGTGRQLAEDFIQVSLQNASMENQLTALGLQVEGMRRAALKAVEDEPNLPGEMPKEFREQFEKLPLDEALRIVVALTKSGIRERILSLPLSSYERRAKAMAEALKNAERILEGMANKAEELAGHILPMTTFVAGPAMCRQVIQEIRDALSSEETK